ncbi:MAG: hypothetical protein LBG80_04595 [Bacteroidales bacterium]|jgi:hypothetical protein|nr:hypothetical protein [Bacteroidales bacterium]
MKHSIRKPALCTAALLFSLSAPSQKLKITDFSSIKDPVKEGAETMSEMAWYIIGTVLLLGLIFVIWQVVSGKPNANTYVIAWFVALVLSIIGGFVV